MKKLKPDTVKKRLTSIAKELHIESERHEVTKLDLRAKMLAVQDKCPHQVEARWHDTWDGWDDHIDLKGHHEYYCVHCHKTLKTDVVRTEHYRLWPDFKKQYE